MSLKIRGMSIRHTITCLLSLSVCAFEVSQSSDINPRFLSLQGSPTGILPSITDFPLTSLRLLEFADMKML